MDTNMNLRRFCIMGLLSFLFGCSNKPHELPNILSETEEGFADMVFVAVEQGPLPSGEYKIEAASIAENEEVALRVILGPKWEYRILGGKLPVYQGVVAIQRVDGRSDKLIQFMDKAYSTAINPLAMKESVSFTAIALEGNPNTPRKGEVRIKLFYESEKEGEYAEAYLNLDLGHDKVCFNEKDPEYRTALVNNLKQ
jgi:hypothetical protein